MFWYVYFFEYGDTSFNPPGLTDPAKFAVSLLYTVALTVCTISMLAVFLAMQPNAYRHLIARITKGERYQPPLPKITAETASSAAARNSVSEMRLSLDLYDDAYAANEADIQWRQSDVSDISQMDDLELLRVVVDSSKLHLSKTRTFHHRDTISETPNAMCIELTESMKKRAEQNSGP